MKTKIKSLISSILEKQEEVYNLVEKLRDHWENEQKVMDIFATAPEHCLAHPQISSLFTEFLQSPNIEVLLSKKELKEIEKIYRLNIAILSNDLSQFEELSHFYTSVYDNEKKALKTIHMGVKNAKTTLKNLKKIRKALEG